MSNRFDPDKVEWPDGDTGPKTFKAWPLDREMVEVQVVPLPIYRELRKAAEQMAVELTARCSCPCQMPKDERCEACRLSANFRGESESNAV